MVGWVVERREEGRSERMLASLANAFSDLLLVDSESVWGDCGWVGQDQETQRQRRERE